MAETGRRGKGFTEEKYAELEECLREFPVAEYAWLGIGELVFSERVRMICREECPRYGRSWACPPAVGTVEECRTRCGEYGTAFVFTTVAEGVDMENMEEMLTSKAGHERTVRALRDTFEESLGRGVLALSADSCGLCGICAYPDTPCRHPEWMLPCVEGYGILVPDLAERAGISLENGTGTVTWFGVILC